MSVKPNTVAMILVGGAVLAYFGSRAVAAKNTATADLLMAQVGQQQALEQAAALQAKMAAQQRSVALDKAYRLQQWQAIKSQQVLLQQKASTLQQQIVALQNAGQPVPPNMPIDLASYNAQLSAMNAQLAVPI